MSYRLSALIVLLFVFTPLVAQQSPFVIIDAEHDYNLDPHTANYSSEAQLFTALYEGLFSYGPQFLEPVPALVEKYKISRDRLRWTFTIREDAKFSNGEQITAQSIKDSWLDVLSLETNAPFASLLDCVKGVHEYRTGKCSSEKVGIAVQGKNKLVVTLNTPTEHLANILCHHSFAAVHPDLSVYSGAFVIDSYADGKLVLKKNTYYHDADSVALEEIHLLQSDDTAENTYQYNIGLADWIISVADINSVIDYDSILITAEFATEYLFFKADKFPWNNAKFRNALLAAVPWEDLRSSAFVPAETFIYPLNGYDSPQGIYDTDLEEAALMIEDAMLEVGLDPSKPLEITIAISDTEYMMNQAQILKEAWKKIGVNVNISKTPSNRYLDSIETWDADIFSYTWIGDFADPQAFLELFKSDASMNVTSWSDSEYDSLLEMAAFSEGFERLEYLADAEDLLLSSGVILPISHPVTLNVIDTEVVGGWFANALDIHPLKYLYKNKVQFDFPNLVKN